jgi:STAS-like domain of unknown function (DUF4325)
MPYCYALAQQGSTLATRPFGRELRADLIQKAVGHRCLELDFSGVLSASHSFVDELVARLAEEAKTGDVEFEISISGAAPDVEAVIHRALGRRNVTVAQFA